MISKKIILCFFFSSLFSKGVSQSPKVIDTLKIHEQIRTFGLDEASLLFKRLIELDHYCLLEITLETGRHHQIRAQLSAIEFPIQGDLKYGAPRSNKDGSISLHARKLKILHPITKEILSFKANPPKTGIWKAVPCD